jgi:hypothetical protein
MLGLVEFSANLTNRKDDIGILGVWYTEQLAGVVVCVVYIIRENRFVVAPEDPVPSKRDFVWVLSKDTRTACRKRIRTNTIIRNVEELDPFGFPVLIIKHTDGRHYVATWRWNFARWATDAIVTLLLCRTRLPRLRCVPKDVMKMIAALVRLSQHDFETWQRLPVPK